MARSRDAYVRAQPAQPGWIESIDGCRNAQGGRTRRAGVRRIAPPPARLFCVLVFLIGPARVPVRL